MDESTHVYSHRGLAPRESDSSSTAVLLEGSWPVAPGAVARLALDDELDNHWRWIDEAADALGRRIAGSGGRYPTEQPSVTLAWLNLLPLRYWLIKLLRVVAWFDSRADLPQGPVLWHFETGRDDDYAALARAIMARQGRRADVVWHPGSAPPPPAFPPNGRWRRFASRWLTGSRATGEQNDRPRAVLCGNPRILDPLCAELVDRGWRVAWLYDRFAAASWLRWRVRGVRQLTCDSSLGAGDELPNWPADLTSELTFRGISLTPLVRDWLTQLSARQGARHSRLAAQVTGHLARFRPDWLVVDEDATPLPRAAIVAARAVDAQSAVVQNSATGVSLAYTSFAADRLFCWGQASRQQLEAWDIPPERIVETGSPWHDALRSRLRPWVPRREADGPRLLLLATPPPRENRPDMVGYHKTTQTYGQMLDWCFAAAAQVGQAQLTIKLHPRAAHAEPFAARARNYPALTTRIVAGGRLEDHFARTDVVLSLGSSAGVEATLAGLPAVQIMPAGSDDLLPAEPWGLLGTARSLDSLAELLREALLLGPTVRPSPAAFFDPSQSASARIADFLGAHRQRREANSSEVVLARGSEPATHAN